MKKYFEIISYIIKRYRIKRLICNKGGIVCKGAKLSISGKFNVGENFILNGQGIDLIKGCKITVSKHSTLTIGDNVGISQSSIFCKNSITIGNFVNIGAGCLIIDSNFHSLDWKIRENRSLDVRNAKTAPVVIGDYVFIGARSIICKGITIGARTIIAAGSVVTEDLPPDCMAGGNPCRVIKNIRN